MQEEINEEEENEHIYHPVYREELIDSDEIDSTEDGFMRGYEQACDEEEEDDEVI